MEIMELHKLTQFVPREIKQLYVIQLSTACGDIQQKLAIKVATLTVSTQKEVLLNSMKHIFS